MSARERVSQAAVKVRGRVFEGMSHKTAVWKASEALDLEPSTIWSEMAAGFTTTTSRFVSRAEAWKVAKRAGQLRWDKSRPGVTPGLHSEDI